LQGKMNGDDLPRAAVQRRCPKLVKLALNVALRTYVEERLAGVVMAPSGVPVR
jgi:hypothetical protein